MRRPWSSRMSYWKKATASEKHTCILAVPAGESAPCPVLLKPALKGPSGKVRRGDLQYCHVDPGGSGEETRHPGVSPSPHAIAALPQGGSSPISSFPLRTIYYNKNHNDNNSSRTPRTCFPWNLCSFWGSKRSKCWFCRAISYCYCQAGPTAELEALLNKGPPQKLQNSIPV